MKKIFVLCAVVLFAFTACNQKQAETKTETSSATVTSKKPEIKLSALSSNKDFVCGMDLEGGAIADTTSFEGKVYGFCSAECKSEFVKKPASYLAQK